LDEIERLEKLLGGSELTMIERFDEEHCDWYLLSKLPVPFANRDFVFSKYCIFDTKQSSCLSYSVDRTDRPIIKGRFRAYYFTSGIILEANPSNPKELTLYTYSNSDVKGSIPVKMINDGVWKEVRKALKRLRKYFETDAEKRNKVLAENYQLSLKVHLEDRNM